MREIKVTKWMTKIPDGSEVEETTISLLSALISMAKPEDMPRGVDSFRTFKRLSDAFENAEKEGTLKLEEGDYSLLKRLIERSIPAIWGMSKNINSATEEFLNAK
jgi:hypothetical protein